MNADGGLNGGIDLARVLAGRRVALSGATGFVGKVVLSMLLHRYPEVGGVVVIARPGTSGSAEARVFAQVLPSPPFDPLRSRYGAGVERFFREKIQVVEGDIAAADLGLSAAGLAEVQRTAALLNCAGLVTFNPSLPLALDVNTAGAGNAAALCRRLSIPLVHVSTCFVAGDRHGPVFEDEPVAGAYPRRGRDGLPLSVPQEIEDCRRLVADVRRQAEDGVLTAAFHEAAIARLRGEGRDPQDEHALRLAVARERKLWLAGELVRLGMDRARRRGWPNTYTYTKALGEQLVAGTEGLSYALARPSIVESALRYPFPGWNEGFTTSAPLAFLGLEGHRSLPAGERCILDMVPVDLVAAGLIAITAAAAAGEQAAVYQLASGDVNPFYAARAVELVGLYRRRVYRRKEGDRIGDQIASRIETRPVGRTRYEWTSAPMARRVAKGLVRLIDEARPRWGAPRLSALAGRARREVSAFARQAEAIESLIDLFLPFLWENSYVFRCDRTRALYAKLTPADREKLPWDPERIDWRTYFMDVHMAGLERWVFPGLAEQRAERKRSGRAHRDLVELFYAAAHAHGARIAFRRVGGEGESEEQVTYAQALDRAERVAARLCRLTVKPGDRVLLVSENRPQWPIAYFGILLAGAVAVPIDPDLGGAEVGNLARASGAQVALISAAARDRLRPNGGTHWIDLDEAMRETGERAPRPHVGGDSPASLIFTSGTTGKPKGVLLSHRNFAQLVSRLAAAFDLDVGDGLLSVLPLHHTFEFSCGLLVPLACGAEITYLDEVTADRLGEVLATGRIHALVGVPALWQLLHRRLTQELAARPGFVQKAYETLAAGNRELRDRTGWNLGKLLFWPIHRGLGGNLRLLVSGGAPLSEEVHDAFRGLGFTLREGYGLTEAAPVLTVTPADEKRPAGSVGRPLPGIELRIADPDDNGVGEVLARGPNIMLGYFGDRESTDAVLADGWLHTGDLGRLDADGNLFLAGRKKDVILGGGGKNVYPDDVEARYREGAPNGLAELCVVGLPGEEGERVACLACLAPGADRARVEEHFRQVSAGLPFSDRIQVLHLREGALPRTATRKIKRPLVIQELSRREEAARVGRLARDERGAAAGSDWLAALLARISRRPAETIGPASRLVQDLGFDSLMLTELSVALEEAGALAADEELTRAGTVAELARAIGPAGGATRRRPAPARREETEISVPPIVAAAGRVFLGEAQRILYEDLFETEISGRAFIPQAGQFLVAGNHASHLDMGLVKIALGEQGEKLCALAARDYFFSTPLRRAYFENFTHLVPMDRQGSLKVSLRLAGEAIDGGRHLLIFPEGTRSPDGVMGEFKPTLGYLALTHGLPVLPVAITGTHEALPKGRVVPRSRKLKVVFGPLIGISELQKAAEGLSRGESYRAATRLVQETVSALLRGEPARPRPVPVVETANRRSGIPEGDAGGEGAAARAARGREP